MKEITAKEARQILKDNGLGNKEVKVSTQRGSYTSMITLKVLVASEYDRLLNIFDGYLVMWNLTNAK